MLFAGIKAASKKRGTGGRIAKECWRQLDSTSHGPITEACADSLVRALPVASALAMQKMTTDGYRFQAKEVDWRPTQTLPEDYYAIAWAGALVGGALLLRALFAPAAPAKEGA